MSELTFLYAYGTQSLDVLPASSMNDVEKRATRDAELPGERVTGIDGSTVSTGPTTSMISFGPDASDFAYVGFGQLSGTDFFSTQPWSGSSLQSTFPRGVLSVLLVRSEEQMIGSDAVADIASVTDVEARRDGTESQFVRESMSKNLLPVIGRVAVTIGSHRATPQPASISPLNLGPESLLDGYAGKVSIGQVSSGHKWSIHACKN